MGERADPYLDSKCRRAYSLGGEGCISLIRIDPWNPLHEVKHPERGVEAKVASGRKILSARRVVGQLVGQELTLPDAELANAEIPQYPSESFEVCWIRRRADVDVLGRADSSVGADREAPDQHIVDLRGVQAPQQPSDVEGVRQLVRSVKPLASAKAALISASACSRFSPRVRAPSARKVSRRARSLCAASSFRR